MPKTVAYKEQATNTLWLPITLEVCNHTYTENVLGYWFFLQTMIASSLPSRKGDILIAFPPPHWRGKKKKKNCLKGQESFSILEKAQKYSTILLQDKPI